MKLLNAPLEMAAIKSICSANQKIAGTILSSVNEDHFYYEPAKEAFHRIISLVRSTGSLPDYTEICADPTITEDSRKILVNNGQKTVKTVDKMDSLLRAIERYRQLRGMFFTFENGIKALEGDKADVEKILEDTTDEIARVRSRGEMRKQLVNIGKHNNSSQVVKDILSGEKKPLLPTGFKTFDSKNGGFTYGSLVTIAATTGGGKSAMANQLLMNMSSLAGEDVALVPLEMTARETMERVLANLSGIPVHKFAQQKLASGERKKVISSYKEYVETLKKQEAKYTIFSPDEDMTIEEILFLLKPYGYKVIIIDYISLLKGVDGDDAWQQLGRVARFAKIFAKTNNIIVVLLAQLSEEGMIRYAKSIKEHSNYMWQWVQTDESKENGIIEVKQVKARNADPFPFQLGQDLSTMRLYDLEEGQGYDEDDDEKPRKGKGGKVEIDRKSKKATDDYLSDLTSGDDDDED